MVLIDEPTPAVLRSHGFASCVAAILGAASLARCDRALLKLHRLARDHAAAFRIQCGSDAVLSSFCCRPTATPPSFRCPVASPLSYRDAVIVALRRRCPAALPSSRSAAVVLPRRRHRFAAAPATPACVLGDGIPPNRPGRQRPSSRTLALQFVHNLPKRVVLPIAVRVFPSFQQFIPFPPSMRSQ